MSLVPWLANGDQLTSQCEGPRVVGATFSDLGVDAVRERE
jgi:hypothetical protein